MGSNKKRGSKNGRNGNEKQNNKKQQNEKANNSSNDEDAEGALRERRLEAVRPYWEKQLDTQKRRELLHIPIEELRKRARLGNEDEIPDDDVPALLERSIKRFQNNKMWKQWRWMATKPEDDQYYDTAEAFREDVRQKVKEETGFGEFPSDTKAASQGEKDFRSRMNSVVEHVRDESQRFHDDMNNNRVRGDRGVRRMTHEQVTETILGNHVALTAKLLEELHREDASLYAMCARPILKHILARLNPNERASTSTYLDFQDMSTLAPQDAASIFEYVMEKAQEIGAERAEPKNEEPMDDIDLFEMDKEEENLTVTSRWLEHLEQRQMNNVGKICKVTADGLVEGDEVDNVKTVMCPRGGLVLDWVFLKIVNTSEKARTSAQSALDGPFLTEGELRECSHEAYQSIVNYVANVQQVKERKAQAKRLLEATLRMSISGDDGSAKAEETKREARVLLLEAKKNNAEQTQRQCSTHLQKAKLDFRRLEGELADLDRFRAEQQQQQNQMHNSGNSGWRRSDEQNASTRQAGIEETNEDRMEIVQELKACKTAMNHIHERQENARRTEADAKNRLELLGGAKEGNGGKEGDNADAEGLTVNELSSQLKARYAELDRQIDKSLAVLGHHEMRLMNIACQDPGVILNSRLTLPYLQDRIEESANMFAEQSARQAEAEILRQVAEESQNQHNNNNSSSNTSLHGKETNNGGWSHNHKKQQHRRRRGHVKTNKDPKQSNEWNLTSSGNKSPNSNSKGENEAESEADAKLKRAMEERERRMEAALAARRDELMAQAQAEAQADVENACKAVDDVEDAAKEPEEGHKLADSVENADDGWTHVKNRRNGLSKRSSREAERVGEVQVKWEEEEEKGKEGATKEEPAASKQATMAEEELDVLKGLIERVRNDNAGEEVASRVSSAIKSLAEARTILSSAV